MKDKCKTKEALGGLQLQHMPYHEQLQYKRKMVIDLIKNVTKVNTPVENVLGMEVPYHYRNKVHVVITSNKKGEILGGLYEENSHKVIPIESSVIHDKKADEIINSIKKILTKMRIPAYDEDRRTGLIRHIVIRRGIKTDQTMVIIVTSSDVFPGRNNFVKALREAHSDINTIIQNTNSRSTSIVLGDKERVLFGRGYIEDYLCGLKFKISAKSFYQVNPLQTEVLYNNAIDFADLKGTETVLDIYCGIGTIGLIASKKAKEVIGVELNNDAIKDAIQNAKNNQISNTRFYCADASSFMNDFVSNNKKIDVVFIDPPRKGCDESLLRSLLKLKPIKIVYISCDPSTLARDLSFLKNDYQIKQIQPVDMFPQTSHVESVVLLVRK
jgi:23S rRNA (uracil1939-C5)-methyltransferase